MKHLELHIIQSVPVACLNRDDLNSPKTAVFGGPQRARVSSQSWKQHIREMAKELSPGHFDRRSYATDGIRLEKRLTENGFAEPAAIAIAEQVADVVETLDSKTDADGLKKIKTLMFFSKAEYAALAKVIAASEDVKGSVRRTSSLVRPWKRPNPKEDVEQATKAKQKALTGMGRVAERIDRQGHQISTAQRRRR